MTVPPPPNQGGVEAPGMARYEELGLREVLREYQKEAVLFLLRMAWCFLALPMRTGKCLVSLAADVALDSRWTLIVAPSLVKWVWASEIAKWMKQPAVILEGRGGREAKRYCLACDGRGMVQDGSWCEACKQLNGQSYGYEIIEVRTVSKPVRAPKIEIPKPRSSRKRHKWTTGPSVRMNLMKEKRYGPFYPRRIDIERMKAERKRINAQFDTGLYQCSKHPEVQSVDKTALCVKCREALLSELRKARYIISNYDIMVAQELKDEAGELLGQRIDLPGWAPVLSRIDFDIAILDESHVLRGRPEKKRRGKNRRDRLKEALKRVKRVWLLTGTPVYGYTRDLWGQLDVASVGLYGEPWYPFDERYCEGHVNEHKGWEANGRSLLAETELEKRLRYIMLKKERSEILKDMPPKQRQVLHIDPKGELARVARQGTRLTTIKRALSTTLDHKIEDIVDNVVNEMSEGNGVLIFTYLKSSAERVMAAVEEEMKKPSRRTRMRAVNAQVWLAHGEVSDKGRFDMARTFRDHCGNRFAGAFVSTIDAMQVGISLMGATSVHFAELHWSPAAMLQAEDRPYEVGITGLSVVYYILKGSIDEHVLNVLTPKFETQVLLTGEEGARDAKQALGGPDAEEEDVDAIWDRLTQHLESGNEDD